MSDLRRVALVAALAVASLPAVAAGQAASNDSLQRRIDVLERTTADLERRMSELESLVKGAPSQDRPLPASANSRDVANWRRLRSGMTMDEVRQVLGEPQRVDASPGWTIWYYPNGAQVMFDTSGKMNGWSEPHAR